MEKSRVDFLKMTLDSTAKRNPEKLKPLANQGDRTVMPRATSGSNAGLRLTTASTFWSVSATKWPNPFTSARESRTEAIPALYATSVRSKALKVNGSE
jgi:hypothetical protein